jgi:hypothetical protein
MQLPKNYKDDEKKGSIQTEDSIIKHQNNLLLSIKKRQGEGVSFELKYKHRKNKILKLKILNRYLKFEI